MPLVYFDSSAFIKLLVSARSGPTVNDDLAQEGVFDTDEELDAFLAHVTAMRHADLA